MQISLLKDIESNLAYIKQVWDDCQWAAQMEDNMLVEILKNSYACFLAFDDDKRPIGFARLISDGVVYALLVDMMITPVARQKGFGKRLVNKVIDFCKSEDIKVLKLISSEQGLGLYSSVGFDVCSEQSPGMMLKLYEDK